MFSCLGVLSIGCALTYILHYPPVDAKIGAQVAKLRFEHRPYLGAADQAFILIDLQADLRVLWNWNVKQIFAWVTAEHTNNAKYHQEVLWDRIITKKEHAKLNLTNERLEYPLTDKERHLRGLPVNLTLRWDIMPTVGILKQGGGLGHNFVQLTLPDKYIK